MDLGLISDNGLCAIKPKLKLLVVLTDSHKLMLFIMLSALKVKC